VKEAEQRKGEAAEKRLREDALFELAFAEMGL
jgi:hypothetical protein